MENNQSKLLEQTREILTRLADSGWHKVFLQHGLDIKKPNLKSEFDRSLTKIKRKCPGFEDFAVNGVRGIEHGKPALSLLYHGFASPNVTGYIDSGSRIEVSKYPTPGELEVLENFVYGFKPELSSKPELSTLEKIREQIGDADWAIVVYAKEYRIASNTPHRKHADMCYSRTGVARVGTAEALYLSDARGYMPEDDTDAKKVRVLPCRYAAYIAAQVKSSALAVQTGVDGDADREFWVPVHKLFSGSECLSGYDLNVKLTANHVNEKLRRIHLKFKDIKHPGGWKEPDLSNPPFRFYEGIAELSESDADGSGLLIPTVHESLVKDATYTKQGEEDEQILTYNVPNSTEGSKTDVLNSSLSILSRRASDGGHPDRPRVRSAPEFVHARFAVDYKGSEEQDLNELAGVGGIVKRGGYKAKHVLDFTGDGWVEAEVVSSPPLNEQTFPRHAAFSLVAPPDYFVKVKQAGLVQWLREPSPPSNRKPVWPQEGAGSPEMLSDERYAANIELEGAGFEKTDDTMTAIVGQLNIKGGEGSRIVPPQLFRNSTLPDGAAGVFAPGWDVSLDETTDGDPKASFLTTYGLGSPFPEDAMLCAALSAYWPAASPDISRTFEPRYATVTPLLDSTIGQDGSQPWDGIRGPKIIDETKKIIEYTNFAYGDYVRGSRDNKFLANAIGDVDQYEYIARTIAMAHVYESLGAKYPVYSFTRADFENDSDLQAALTKTHSSLEPVYSYRFEVFEPKPVADRDRTGKPFDKIWVGYEDMLVLYADSKTVLMKDGDGEWTVVP